MRSLLRTARGRTLVGLALAILFVPVMLGISACLDTPIGDAEKGWVDPRITGVWLAGEPVPEDYNAQVWIFEPYDSRTWLVTWIGYGEADQEGEQELPVDETGSGTDAEPATTGSASGEAVTPGVAEPATQETPEIPAAPLASSDVLRILETLADERVEPEGQYVFKGWLTSIADRRFLVLEPKVSLDSEQAFRPEAWFVYRVVLKGERMELALVSGGFDDLAEVKSRGEAEQIIARHVADPDLYDDTYSIYRVPKSSYDEVADLLERAGFMDW